jgi:aminopeptidase N
VNLDPVTVTENMPGSTVYRGSYTRKTDLINTRLDLSFDWDSAYVHGKATIQAKPYFYATDQLLLNANGFRIKNVSLVNNYDKKPLQYGMYFINLDGKDKDKPKQIWTQGETECNSNWFPTINDTQEKMTQELNITVPNEFVSLSNGTLEFSSMNGDGTRTDSWRQEQPHSTYLTMLAVGNFTITKDKWRDKEVSYYTEPAFASTARLVFGNTPQMMEFFSVKLGVDYPWDKYSQIVVRDFVS